MIFDDEGQIIGTTELFDDVDDCQLAEMLNRLTLDQLMLVPDEYLKRWELSARELAGDYYYGEHTFF